MPYTTKPPFDATGADAGARRLIIIIIAKPTRMMVAIIFLFLLINLSIIIIIKYFIPLALVRKQYSFRVV